MIIINLWNKKVMEIFVVKVVDKKFIHVNCKYGAFIGKWMDENIPNNGKYYVEIDFNKILNYKIVNDKNYCIKNVEEKILLKV